jgi:hypothetical protein
MTIQEEKPDHRLNHAAGMVQVLAHLSARAQENKGWQRRGVRGWVFTDELGNLAFAGELLTAAAARGFAIREDVLDPGRRLPLYINRITQAGEDYLAQHEGREPGKIRAAQRSVTEADAETLYVPSGAWTGLRALATIPDPEEWISASRMGLGFYAEDRKFLLSRGLIEVLRPASGRPSEGLRYRATALGREASARDTTTSAGRSQVRVRGLALRNATRTPVPNADPGAER